MTAAPQSTALAPKAPTELANRTRYSWIQIVREIGHADREALMMAGTAPAFESLLGWEFAGANTLSLTRLIGIRKFTKGFYEGPARSSAPTPGASPSSPPRFIQGYNIVVRQNGDEAPHQYVPSDEKPTRHGFYRVHKVEPSAPDNRYPNALLLDYGLGGNGLFGPPLRDYIVQVYPDDPDLLLGKAYLALGGLRIPVSFFVLKRLKQHSFAG